MESITIGEYGTTGYTFFPASKRITVYDYFWDFFGLVKTVFNNTQNILIGAPVNWKATLAYTVPQTPIVAGTPTSGGVVTVGTHSYYVSFIIGSGETLLSAKSNIITAVLTTGQTVSLNVPLGPPKTIARNIYRTIAGDTGNPLFIATISDNTTTTYSDIIPDATIVASTQIYPTTTNCYDIDYNTTILGALATNDRIDIVTKFVDESFDQGLKLNKIQEQSPAKIPLSGWQVAYISESALAVNVNPYYRQIQCNIQAGWTELCCFIKATCATTSTTFKVYATSNTVPTIPADLAALSTLSVDWIDVTAQIFVNDPAYVSVNNNIVIPITGTYQSMMNWSIVDLNKNKIVPDSYLVVITSSNATNTFQIDINNF